MSATINVTILSRKPDRNLRVPEPRFTQDGRRWDCGRCHVGNTFPTAQAATEWAEAHRCHWGEYSVHGGIPG